MGIIVIVIIGTHVSFDPKSSIGSLCRLEHYRRSILESQLTGSGSGPLVKQKAREKQKLFER